MVNFELTPYIIYDIYSFVKYKPLFFLQNDEKGTKSTFFACAFVPYFPKTRKTEAAEAAFWEAWASAVWGAVQARAALSLPLHPKGKAVP